MRMRCETISEASRCILEEMLAQHSRDPTRLPRDLVQKGVHIKPSECSRAKHWNVAWVIVPFAPDSGYTAKMS